MNIGMTRAQAEEAAPADGSVPSFLGAPEPIEPERTVDADVIQQVPAHKGWVDLHEGAHFRKWVGDLISLVNEYCSIDGPEAEVFRTIVHLERRFFDDSYPQE